MFWKIFDTQKALVRSSEEMKNLYRHLEGIREAERLRISRDIHDHLGQVMTGIKMETLRLKREVVRKTPVMRERLQSIVNLTDAAIDSVRDLARSLRPAILDDLGVASAIRSYIEDFESRTGITAEDHIEEFDMEYDKEMSIDLFRIVQECLTNVARHAQAKSVTVSLGKMDNRAIRLFVEDDGRGISDDEMASPTSYGLLGMRERIGKWGGDMEIIRSEKGGTLIDVILPIQGDVQGMDT